MVGDLTAQDIWKQTLLEIWQDLWKILAYWRLFLKNLVMKSTLEKKLVTQTLYASSSFHQLD